MRIYAIWLCSALFTALPVYAAEKGINDLVIGLARRDAFSDCLDTDFEEGCKKSPADCFATMCNACQSVVVIAECCGLAADSAKLVCLNNAMANPAALTMTKGVTGTSTSRTTSITIAPASGLAACSGVLATWQSCGSKTSGFSTLLFNQQAPCLCSKSGTMNASAYDGPWSTCLAFASTTSPALYSSLTQAFGSDRAPCSKAGNSNKTSMFAASSVWYIGYTVGPGAQPTVQFASQSSALTTMTTTASATVKPNNGHRNSLVCETFLHDRSYI